MNAGRIRRASREARHLIARLLNRNVAEAVSAADVLGEPRAMSSFRAFRFRALFFSTLRTPYHRFARFSSLLAQSLHFSSHVFSPLFRAFLQALLSLFFSFSGSEHPWIVSHTKQKMLSQSSLLPLTPGRGREYPLTISRSFSKRRQSEGDGRYEPKRNVLSQPLERYSLAEESEEASTSGQNSPIQSRSSEDSEDEVEVLVDDSVYCRPPPLKILPRYQQFTLVSRLEQLPVTKRTK